MFMRILPFLLALMLLTGCAMAEGGQSTSELSNENQANTMLQLPSVVPSPAPASQDPVLEAKYLAALGWYQSGSYEDYLRAREQFSELAQANYKDSQFYLTVCNELLKLLAPTPAPTAAPTPTGTPSPTPAPTATPVPTPTPAPDWREATFTSTNTNNTFFKGSDFIGVRCVITIWEARLHGGPGEMYPSLDECVLRFQSHEILDIAVEEETNKLWYKLSVNGTEGWLSSYLAKVKQVKNFVLLID